MRAKAIRFGLKAEIEKEISHSVTTLYFASAPRRFAFARKGTGIMLGLARKVQALVQRREERLYDDIMRPGVTQELGLCDSVHRWPDESSMKIMARR